MLNARSLTIGLTVIGAVALGACGQEQAAPSDNKTMTSAQSGEATDPAALARAALENPRRPEADRADDPLRKPVQVLTFAGIKPGMTVFEMEAGRGYYTELKSYMVGPDGEVIMHTPPPLTFLEEPIAERLRDNRLPNVRLTKTNFDNLEAADESVDMVTWFLGPHELYFTPTGSDGLGDVKETYAEVFRILKPGGTFVILDHAAAPGSPPTTGGVTHRIDPAIVKGLLEDAGFEFVAESDIMRNPDDNYDMSVFDPAVRRQTDRFLLKYKKPEDTSNDTD